MWTDFDNLLSESRDSIIEEWLTRLKTEVSPRYASRPRTELLGTISAAFDANVQALINNDYSKLDELTRFIGNLRGQAGFPLSEVQNAFELFRSIILPVLDTRIGLGNALPILERVNTSLAYTIHKFSDQFQELHERGIKEHARKLEITVQERTKQLAESERKYRQLVEEIRDGCFIYRKARIVFANQAFCDMHGYSLSEVINRRSKEFVAPESYQEVKELYRDFMAKKFSEDQYVYWRLNKNGEKFPTENKVILTQYEGEPAVLGICRDITERMEIEKRVREAERLAHIGQLTTSIAHEIRNPLSAANMSIQDLLKSVSVSGNDKRRIEILGKEITRVDRILTEMLDFAKPMKYDFQPLSIDALIHSCLDVLETRIRGKDVVVRIDLPEGSPAPVLDREKMVQALINVLLNSIEAVGQGGRVEISAAQAAGSLRIDIVDNGPGIAEEDVQFIFDPFFSRKKRGTGLGLANARKIVEAHGGKIDLRPARSGGTLVTIDLPVSRLSAGDAGKPVRGTNGLMDAEMQDANDR
ncbi:MAG: ATP-binding protein [Pseudomonadota bacterium]